MGDCVADVIAVVSSVSQKHFSIWQIIIDQCVKAFEVRDFASSYFRPDRQSVSVGNEVDLGRKATL